MEHEFETPVASGFSVPQFYEYLLVIHPAQEAYEEIMKEKQYFYQTYKEPVAIKTKPHITVANFFARDVMEERIISYMTRILNVQKSFTVLLNNYSGFPPHTVFARVQDHQPFRQLTDSLKPVAQYVKTNGCPPAKLITYPHVSIARRLKENVYDKAMFEFSQRTFYAIFPVNELLLLRRQHQYDTCKQINIFKLQAA